MRRYRVLSGGKGTSPRQRAASRQRERGKDASGHKRDLSPPLRKRERRERDELRALAAANGAAKFNKAAVDAKERRGQNSRERRREARRKVPAKPSQRRRDRDGDAQARLLV